MKNIFLSTVICMGILLGPIMSVSAHHPQLHKRHLRLHHPDIKLIVIDEEACANGALAKILKGAKRGTVIVIRSAKKVIKGAGKVIIRPFRCPDCRLEVTKPNCKPKVDNKKGGCCPKKSERKINKREKKNER